MPITSCKLTNLLFKLANTQTLPPSTSTTTVSSSSYAPLINLVERVFQSYEYLSQSFTFKKEPHDVVQMSTTMPSMPPFNIDFNSLRRSFSQLFAISNEKALDELEKKLDFSVKTLCFSVRMLLKRAETSEQELVKIMHALLVVNELPMLEDPKYMEESAKVFYATFSELPSAAAAKIVRLWSRWHADELRIFLNRLQQYITVCVISKNMDEDASHNDENDEDEEREDKNCLHNSEGISGAVGCLKFIYYASVLGMLLVELLKKIEKSTFYRI